MITLQDTTHSVDFKIENTQSINIEEEGSHKVHRINKQREKKLGEQIKPKKKKRKNIGGIRIDEGAETKQSYFESLCNDNYVCNLKQLMHCQTAWTFMISQQRMRQRDWDWEWTEIDTTNTHKTREIKETMDNETECRGRRGIDRHSTYNRHYISN